MVEQFGNTRCDFLFMSTVHFPGAPRQAFVGEDLLKMVVLLDALVLDEAGGTPYRGFGNVLKIDVVFEERSAKGYSVTAAAGAAKVGRGLEGLKSLGEEYVRNYFEICVQRFLVDVVREDFNAEGVSLRGGVEQWAELGQLVQQSLGNLKGRGNVCCHMRGSTFPSSAIDSIDWGSVDLFFELFPLNARKRAGSRKSHKFGPLGKASIAESRLSLMLQSHQDFRRASSALHTHSCQMGSEVLVRINEFRRKNLCTYFDGIELVRRVAIGSGQPVVA